MLVNSVEELDEIFSEDYDFDSSLSDLDSFIILAKYKGKQKDIITGAEHDEYYSFTAQHLIEQKITIEDAKSLRNHGWLLNDDVLSKFA
jgi:hypothetical protein